MKGSQLFQNAFMLVSISCCLIPCGSSQTFSAHNTIGGQIVTICGVPKLSSVSLNGLDRDVNGCFAFNPVDGNGRPMLAMATSNFQILMMAQISDLKDQLAALNQAVNALKQSNEDAAHASQAAVDAIQKENTQFNRDFGAAINAKLENYPADFVKSPAYQQLKKELTDLINQRLGTPVAAPTSGQPPAASVPGNSGTVPASPKSDSSGGTTPPASSASAVPPPAPMLTSANSKK